MRGRPDDGTWTDKDRVMALALTMYEDGLCADCGGHHSTVQGDGNVGRWEVAETICHRCAAIESYRDGNKDSYPGQKLSVIDAAGA